MTGLEATSDLFKFFSENDYFEMGQHFGSVILISDNKELEEACLELGLEEMGEMGVIVKVTKKDKFILTTVLIIIFVGVLGLGLVGVVVTVLG